MHAVRDLREDWPLTPPRIEMLELAYFAAFDRAPPVQPGQDEASRSRALIQALASGEPLQAAGGWPAWAEAA